MSERFGRVFKKADNCRINQVFEFSIPDDLPEGGAKIVYRTCDDPANDIHYENVDLTVTDEAKHVLCGKWGCGGCVFNTTGRPWSVKPENTNI